MTENEFILQDRIAKIKSVIEKYGEDNFYLAFSGGKDSTVLSALLDMACPGNKIPRVYANTGIELDIIRDFVIKTQKQDNRIIIIKPTKPIKTILNEYGYPFKSKEHSQFVKRYQKRGYIKSVQQYLGIRNDKKPWARPCPSILKYQFTDENKIKISDECCNILKENPILSYSIQNKKPYGIVGIMADENGRRRTAKCLSFNNGKLKNFQPLTPITKNWENWYIQQYNVNICDIYNNPYNFDRTGCKGCPFALNLQNELDILKKYFPNERKQCEIIWQPIYSEYRRLGYRLKVNKTEFEYLKKIGVM